LSANLPFIDLASQRDRIRPQIDSAIARVVDHGAFIMGPEVGRFEEELSAFAGAKHTVSCSNGTDALTLVLMAWQIGPGDAVFCPSFTFAATAEVVAFLGATPVFVDIHADTFNMDPASLRTAIGEVKAKGELRPRAVIAVDLFGQMADYPAIRALCDEHELSLISDAAQGFGATLEGQRANVFADAVTTSFFPAKPLGCYGDGGAIQTQDDDLAAILRSLRVHGAGSDRYDNVRIGMTGRLDTIQAAVLIEKLAIFEDEIAARGRIAERYNVLLADVADVPVLADGAVSTWAQYTIKLPVGARPAFQAALGKAGVPTAIYYPKPLHRQTAYKGFPVAGNGLPASDAVAEQVIALPMHPYLSEADQDRIVAAAREALGADALAAAS
jgi:dTDP-4-amino-4,6-dideoxygalactose transaminase